jgi:hypothetical protein
MIRLVLPDDMRARDGFGYATEGAVDSRYMPEEAVGPGDRIELTDRTQVITRAIDVAKMQERSWPTVQYLWDGHPILEWFRDRASTFFPEHSAPVVSLKGRMPPGEVAVMLHGAIPNANGAPVVDRWVMVVTDPDGGLRLEEVDDFFARTHFAGDTPNRPIEDLTPAKSAIHDAVRHFQVHLVELRQTREKEVDQDLDVVLDRLASLEKRFKAQLALQLGDLPENEDALTTAQKRRLTKQRMEEQKVEDLFSDWSEWFERTRKMVADPNPHVDVKAVFLG